MSYVDAGRKPAAFGRRGPLGRVAGSASGLRTVDCGQIRVGQGFTWCGGRTGARWRSSWGLRSGSDRVRRFTMMRTHQPGQAVFRSVLPEDIDWKPFPAFPAPARLAVVVGQPTEPGPYVIRVKVPSGVTLMPHRHPE